MPAGNASSNLLCLIHPAVSFLGHWHRDSTHMCIVPGCLAGTLWGCGSCLLHGFSWPHLRPGALQTRGPASQKELERGVYLRRAVFSFSIRANASPSDAAPPRVACSVGLPCSAAAFTTPLRHCACMQRATPMPAAGQSTHSLHGLVPLPFSAFGTQAWLPHTYLLPACYPCLGKEADCTGTDLCLPHWHTRRRKGREERRRLHCNRKTVAQQKQARHLPGKETASLTSPACKHATPPEHPSHKHQHLRRGLTNCVWAGHAYGRRIPLI